MLWAIVVQSPHSFAANRIWGMMRADPRYLDYFSATISQQARAGNRKIRRATDPIRSIVD
jgi:hypothetical protein